MAVRTAGTGGVRDGCTVVLLQPAEVASATEREGASPAECGRYLQSITWLKTCE